MLIGVCFVVQLRDLRPDRLGWEHSLPLHICDITGLLAAVAMLTGFRFARSIVYFWGLTLSSQAFIFPILRAGPVHTDFWLYWLHHGAIITTAIYDRVVLRFQPTWRDWNAAALLLAVYAIVLTPFDVIMNVNYGYLNAVSHEQRSMVVAFGEWPDRIAALWLTSVSGMAVLKLLWASTDADAADPGSIDTEHLTLPMVKLPADRVLKSIVPNVSKAAA